MSVVTVGCRKSTGRCLCGWVTKGQGQGKTYRSRSPGRVPKDSEIGLGLKVQGMA